MQVLKQYNYYKQLEILGQNQNSNPYYLIRLDFTLFSREFFIFFCCC